MLVRALAIIALISLVAEGGQWERRRRREPPPVELTPTIVPNFSFARVRFHSFREGRRPGWSHDYPRAERNLLRILSEVTDVYTEPAAHTIVPLDSPDLMLHPLAYFSEPGTWAITPDETTNFRNYLAKGEFALFDDFDGPWDWENFEACMASVLPGRHFERLELEDPVFQSFFHIKTLEMPAGYGSYEAPSFWGLRDDDGRLMVVANFNNDIGEYWEWSEHGYYPIELTNEGYKLGVNYVIYSLTH